MVTSSRVSATRATGPTARAEDAVLNPALGTGADLKDTELSGVSLSVLPPPYKQRSGCCCLVPEANFNYVGHPLYMHGSISLADCPLLRQGEPAAPEPNLR